MNNFITIKILYSTSRGSNFAYRVIINLKIYYVQVHC